jgi:hypothetical protein
MLKKRNIVILTAILITLMQFSVLTYAQKDTDTVSSFTDVGQEHWAYDAINWMIKNKVISGYPDNTFKPERVVTRAEFSKIMVLALNLQLRTPEERTFNDLNKNHWAYTFVESAKYYLTGFRSRDGVDNFYPDREAVREDMAVALVRAKNYQNESVDESILNVFSDRDSISPNLKKDVAIALKHEIMIGSPVEGSEQNVFRPQGFLTRAEAAALIYNVLKNNSQEEKVTYDNPYNSNNTGGQTEGNDVFPITEGDSIYDYPVPVVQSEIKEGKIYLSWTKAAENKFNYYKVVVSKNNSVPVYPQDGYLYVISDREKTVVEIGDEGYNGGDFGGRLIPGEKYYFSVTAVYDDAKVPGNSLALVYQEQAVQQNESPKLSGQIKDDKIYLSWDTASQSGFTYYKIVISKDNSSPKYPDNGYLCYYTDKNRTYMTIDNKERYNGGDFGEYLIPGESYYFSITYVYSNKKVFTNTLRLTYPENSMENQTSKRSGPVLRGSVVGKKIVLTWSPVDPSGFVYYKVVISKDDSTPVYPEDGYLYVISDVNKTNAVIDNSSPYNGGGFGKYLISGQKYYFSITAVYENEKISGNTVQLIYP